MDWTSRRTFVLQHLYRNQRQLPPPYPHYLYGTPRCQPPPPPPSPYACRRGRRRRAPVRQPLNLPGPEPLPFGDDLPHLVYKNTRYSLATVASGLLDRDRFVAGAVDRTFGPEDVGYCAYADAETFGPFPKAVDYYPRSPQVSYAPPAGLPVDLDDYCPPTPPHCDDFVRFDQLTTNAPTRRPNRKPNGRINEPPIFVDPARTDPNAVDQNRTSVVLDLDRFVRQSPKPARKPARAKGRFKSKDSSFVDVPGRASFFDAITEETEAEYESYLTRNYEQDGFNFTADFNSDPFEPTRITRRTYFYQDVVGTSFENTYDSLLNVVVPDRTRPDDPASENEERSPRASKADGGDVADDWRPTATPWPRDDGSFGVSYDWESIFNSLQPGTGRGASETPGAVGIAAGTEGNDKDPGQDDADSKNDDGSSKLDEKTSPSNKRSVRIDLVSKNQDSRARKITNMKEKSMAELRKSISSLRDDKNTLGFGDDSRISDGSPQVHEQTKSALHSFRKRDYIAKKQDGTEDGRTKESQDGRPTLTCQTEIESRSIKTPKKRKLKRKDEHPLSTSAGQQGGARSTAVKKINMAAVPKDLNSPEARKIEEQWIQQIYEKTGKLPPFRISFGKFRPKIPETDVLDAIQPKDERE